VGYPSLASEFPNDNAEISSGVIWVHADLVGPATAELVPFRPVAAEPFVLYFDEEEPYVDGPVEIQVSVEGPGMAVHVAPPPVTVQQPEDPPAFRHFEQALLGALMAQGASRSAAILPKLLRLEALPAEALTKDVQLTLQSRGYLDGSGRYTTKYRDLCGAWSGVLHGSTQDLAACGTNTLDRFGADLLAALLAVPATRADELRRQLRKAGIAAFGVLEAA
jgi:hypothetical protein